MTKMGFVGKKVGIDVGQASKNAYHGVDNGGQRQRDKDSKIESE